MVMVILSTLAPTGWPMALPFIRFVPESLPFFSSPFAKSLMEYKRHGGKGLLLPDQMNLIKQQACLL
jgi:hypothetical protein